MARLLVLFAHPALEKSRVHSAMVAVAPQGPEFTFHDLYEAYPRLDIDVAREQELLSRHDVVVLQFPFYWYSPPPILKQWEDLVLEHGWAYGSQGTALRGKTLMCAISTGGREGAYQPAGYNRFTVRQLLAPVEQTTRLCGMRYLPPWVAYGTHSYGEREISATAKSYRTLLEGLHDELPLPEEAVLDGMVNLNEVAARWGGDAIAEPGGQRSGGDEEPAN